ncbi:MAG: hypothetical protein A2Z14_00285 [Chloroflexi bacterium RBG_16_48_8]|nr:MAG: hypothetical protein A2Z14_00285 [Chloroflexi bacterium RBG_16_48_8]
MKFHDVNELVILPSHPSFHRITLFEHLPILDPAAGLIPHPPRRIDVNRVQQARPSTMNALGGMIIYQPVVSFIAFLPQNDAILSPTPT